MSRYKALRQAALIIVSLLTLMFGIEARAVDIEPLHVDIDVYGQAFLGEGCEGGEWSVSWSADVPGETNNISDLLISYGSFDTTNESDPQIPPATVKVKDITCRDQNGAVVLHTSMGGGKREVRTVVALKHDPGIPSPFLDFSVDDAGICRVRAETMNQVLENNLIQIRAPLMATLTPDLSVSREELEKGFSKRYKIEGQAVVSAIMCMGTPIDHAQVTLSYKRNDKAPAVSLAGCANLPKGGSTQVTAKVDPPGGRLQFSADPATTLGIQSSGLSATVTGASPGRATLKAEYTLNGKTAMATLPASSIELTSVNNGVAIPKLGLLGLNGKPSSKVYSFPFKSTPGDAGDLLIFKLQQEALASVVTNRNSIGIQPVREGRTLLQAKTVCGAPVGPPIEIEIVTCDDDVRGELQQRQEELIRREKEIVKRITQLVGDAEFQRAATEIKDSTINLATKTAEVIAATLTVGEANAVKNGVGSVTNLHQIETAQTLWDGYSAFNDAQSGNYGAAAFGALVIAINDARVSALKAAWESADAAQKFGMDLGLIAGVVEQLDELEPQHDAIRRDIDQVTRRLHQCDKLPPPPPLPPKKPDPKPPRPTEPPPVEVPPVTDIPVPEQPPEVPGEEVPPIIDPPDVPVSGGLCVRRVDEPIPANELKAILQSANEFKTTAQRAREVFESFQATIKEMEAANSLQGDQRTSAMSAFAPRYDAFVQEYFKLGAASRAQSQKFALCTEELPKQISTTKNSAAQR
ncbi:MAG: hypothetical protein ACJ8OJ_20730 [Povalibacter sp.]